MCLVGVPQSQSQLSLYSVKCPSWNYTETKKYLTTFRRGGKRGKLVCERHHPSQFHDVFSSHGNHFEIHGFADAYQPITTGWIASQFCVGWQTVESGQPLCEIWVKKLVSWWKQHGVMYQQTKTQAILELLRITAHMKRFINGYRKLVDLHESPVSLGIRKFLALSFPVLLQQDPSHQRSGSLLGLVCGFSRAHAGLGGERAFPFGLFLFLVW